MIPEGATQITTEELLQIIGELFVQSRVQQRLLANQSQQLVAASNGRVEDVPVRS